MRKFFGARREILAAALLCAGLIVTSAATAFADATPEATVKEIVGKIKSTGNASPIVEYVDWSKAYADFPAQQREQLTIKSPDEMKKFFRDVLANPTETMKSQMKSRMSSLTPDQQKQADQAMVQLEDMMKAKEKEMKDRIANTDYDVGESKVEGDKATVKLTQNYKGEKKQEDIKLEKKGDRWMLPSLNLAQTAPPGGPPQGTPPVPESLGGPGGSPAGGAPAAHP